MRTKEQYYDLVLENRRLADRPRDYKMQMPKCAMRLAWQMQRMCRATYIP